MSPTLDDLLNLPAFYERAWLDPIERPLEFVQPFLRFVQPQWKVLDVAAGNGKHTIPFATFGAHVDAIDISRTGLSVIDHVASTRKLRVTTKLLDVKDIKTLHIKYDVIICTYALHELSQDDALALLKNIQDMTVEGGVNLIGAFRASSEIAQIFKDLRKHTYFPHDDEIRHIYNSWNRNVYREIDATTLGNKKVELIATKPFS